MDIKIDQSNISSSEIKKNGLGWEILSFLDSLCRNINTCICMNYSKKIKINIK